MPSVASLRPAMTTAKVEAWLDYAAISGLQPMHLVLVNGATGPRI